MNRLIEIVAMTVGGLSLFLVCFVGFASLSGRDVSKVPVIGKLFPAPSEPGADEHASGDATEPEKGAKKPPSDAAVIEASLGVLSAWTLPSPYSTSELRVLSEELKRKRAELDERELALARRERSVGAEETELEERMRTLEELRQHLESLQGELSARELEVHQLEDSARAGQDARWADVARVIGAIEASSDAAKRLLEYPPGDAAKILRALGDEGRAGEILNAVPGERWKELVDAYTLEKARAPAKRK